MPNQPDAETIMQLVCDDADRAASKDPQDLAALVSDILDMRHSQIGERYVVALRLLHVAAHTEDAG